MILAPTIAEPLGATPRCVIDIGGAIRPKSRAAEMQGQFIRHLLADARRSYSSQSSTDLLETSGGRSCEEAADQISADVDTLNAALRFHQEWQVSFAKFDVGRFDLDALGGGSEPTMRVLGTQIEVSSDDRILDTPPPLELGGWLRKARGGSHFMIREFGIRKNGVYRTLNRSRAVRTDAVYFRRIDLITSWLKAALSLRRGEERVRAFVKIFLAQAAHHDPAELTITARLAGVSRKEVSEAEELRTTAPQLSVAVRCSSATILAMSALLEARGWDAARLIGSRVRPLMDRLSNAVRRGDLTRSCLAGL